MRDIKFRGIRLDTGKWAYGLFCRCKNGNLIYPCIQIEQESDFGDYFTDRIIDGETLGQYTGFKDKNKKEIYEGDLVNLFMFDDSVADEDNPTLIYKGTYEVFYDCGDTMYSLKSEKENWLPNALGFFTVEVIGNIYPKKVYFVSDEVGEVFSYAGE